MKLSGRGHRLAQGKDTLTYPGQLAERAAALQLMRGR
jgi:hypothetical protein